AVAVAAVEEVIPTAAAEAVVARPAVQDRVDRVEVAGDGGRVAAVVAVDDQPAQPRAVELAPADAVDQHLDHRGTADAPDHDGVVAVAAADEQGPAVRTAGVGGHEDAVDGHAPAVGDQGADGAGDTAGERDGGGPVVLGGPLGVAAGVRVAGLRVARAAVLLA